MILNFNNLVLSNTSENVQNVIKMAPVEKYISWKKIIKIAKRVDPRLRYDLIAPICSARHLDETFLNKNILTFSSSSFLPSIVKSNFFLLTDQLFLFF